MEKEPLSIIEDLGLTKLESRVYLELIKLGSTTTGPLIKKTELHRATVYDLLKRLVEKGLVNYITKKKTKYFQATDPKKFLDLITTEEEKLKSKKKNTEKLIFELEKIKKTALNKEEAHVFVGKSGVKYIYELSLKYKENWIWGSHGRAKESLGKFFDIIRIKRKKLKISTKLLISERMRGTFLADLKWGHQVRFLPKEFDNPTATLIFGNNIAIIAWTETPIAFLIESKEVADAFKNYFNIMWEAAKK